MSCEVSKGHEPHNSETLCWCCSLSGRGCKGANTLILIDTLRLGLLDMTSSCHLKENRRSSQFRPLRPENRSVLCLHRNSEYVCHVMAHSSILLETVRPNCCYSFRNQAVRPPQGPTGTVLESWVSGALKSGSLGYLPPCFQIWHTWSRSG